MFDADLYSTALIILLLVYALQHDSLFEWADLPPLPDRLGFGGPFAGVSNGALIVAGGSNFPEAPPWAGGKKVWVDSVFVLERPDAPWKIGPPLPRPLGYGVSVPTERGLVLIGGSDAERHHRDVFQLEWKDGRLLRADLPPLPGPCANSCGARIGDVIYVAGGLETPGSAAAMRNFWALDLARREWRELEPWPGPERMLSVAAVQEGAFFLLSGARLVPGEEGKPKREYLKDAYRYAPERGWSRIADLPRPAVAAPTPAFPMGPAHILVVGGDDGAQVAAAPDAHRGFPRDLLAYHTITNTWTRRGETPAPQVTTALVPWGEGFVVPSGEIRPAVRTTRVAWARVSADKPGFGAFNYAALGLYPLVMLGIAAFVGRKRTSDEYFRGGQRVPWWAAGLSIFATMLSSLTFMAIPAKAYASDWSFILNNVAAALLAPLVILVYLPFFRRIDVTSAYEYLERRFNVAARLFGSLSFIAFQLGRTAIVLYLPAIALATVSQFPLAACILVLGAVCILMTFMGGIESVIWTDVAQSVILLVGALVSLGVVISRCDDFMGVALADGKFFGSLTWTGDLSVATGWILLFGNLFSNLAPYTASQDVVQRYMTVKDDRAAARAIWTNAALTIPVSVLFFGLGTALYVFYKSHPERLDPRLTTDAIFPLFMVRELPAGIGGLVVAGLFAAGQPTSNLNSMATAFVTDFTRRFSPGVSDASALRTAQGVTVASGILGTGVALVLATFDIRSLWELFLALLGLLGSALAGLFALGIFTRRANGPGAVIGALASVTVLFLVRQKVHFFAYGVIGVMTCFVVGYLASLPFRQKRDLTDLTLFTFTERR